MLGSLLLGTGLPSRDVRIHGEYWRLSGPCAGVFRTVGLDPLQTSASILAVLHNSPHFNDNRVDALSRSTRP
jgi:hypothetical protein